MQRTKSLLLLQTFSSPSLKEIVKGLALGTSFQNGSARLAQLTPKCVGAQSRSLGQSSAKQDRRAQSQSSPAAPSISAGTVTLGRESQSSLDGPGNQRAAYAGVCRVGHTGAELSRCHLSL